MFHESSVVVCMVVLHSSSPILAVFSNSAHPRIKLPSSQLRTKNGSLRYWDNIKISYNFTGSTTGVYVSNTTLWATSGPTTKASRASNALLLNSLSKLDGITKSLPALLSFTLNALFTTIFQLVTSSSHHLWTPRLATSGV